MKYHFSIQNERALLKSNGDDIFPEAVVEENLYCTETSMNFYVQPFVLFKLEFPALYWWFPDTLRTVSERLPWF